MATEFNVRVGDADREAVAAQLREHYADGRLTLDELNERLDQAFAAKTRADLNMVLRDLPHSVPPAVAQSSGWDRGRPFAAFAPLAGLAWVFIILGSVLLFGLPGGGGRPIAIAVFLAALALLRRLLGLGRRRGYPGPRGPRAPRGPRGPRGRRYWC
jgi:hypothetical protein